MAHFRNRHAFEDIQATMHILHFQTKGMHLNTTEHFYIYKEASVISQLNDDHTIPNNKIFETLLKEFQGTSH